MVTRFIPATLPGTLWLALFGYLPVAAQAGADPPTPSASHAEGTAFALGGREPHPRRPTVQPLDVTQANLMLDLLESIAEGRQESELLDGY
jgi:hypothetical protein